MFRSQRVEKAFINFIRVFFKTSEGEVRPIWQLLFPCYSGLTRTKPAAMDLFRIQPSASRRNWTHFIIAIIVFPPLWNQPGSPWCSLFSLSLRPVLCFCFTLFLFVFSYLCNPLYLPLICSVLSSNISPFHFTQYLAALILVHLSFTCPLIPQLLLCEPSQYPPVFSFKYKTKTWRKKWITINSGQLDLWSAKWDD